jgi:hypothetical protein
LIQIKVMVTNRNYRALVEPGKIVLPTASIVILSGIALMFIVFGASLMRGDLHSRRD